MASLFATRPLRSFLPCPNYICKRCLSASPSLQSGHNRWSKIKHEKAATDMKRNVQFAGFSHEIALASRRTLNPTYNSQF